jgi:hypothetical protein
MPIYIITNVVCLSVPKVLTWHSFLAYISQKNKSGVYEISMLPVCPPDRVSSTNNY